MANTGTSALIFDLDGTIIDSMPWHAKSWIEFARRHRFDIEVKELLRRTTGRTGAECMAELFQREMAPDEAWRLVQEKESIYRELYAPVFAEVKGFKFFLAAALQRGLKIAIGTAGDRHNIAFALGRLQLATPPDAVVGGDEGLAGKPQPDIFHEAARRIGATPESCIVFEDAPFGIEAARRAGMRAVAICTSHAADELAGPHVLTHVSSYHELLDCRFSENLDVEVA